MVAKYMICQESCRDWTSKFINPRGFGTAFGARGGRNVNQQDFSNRFRAQRRMCLAFSSASMKAKGALDVALGWRAVSSFAVQICAGLCLACFKYGSKNLKPWAPQFVILQSGRRRSAQVSRLCKASAILSDNMPHPNGRLWTFFQVGFL